MTVLPALPEDCPSSSFNLLRERNHLMTTFRHILRASLVAPLALALAACGSETTGEDSLEGGPIAPIAAPEGTSWLDQVSVTEADGYLVGNPDAPLKLIEYGSLTCGACANFAIESDGKKSSYIESGVVSFELRNQVHNAVDLTLARLVRCSAPGSVQPLAEQVWKNLPTLLEPASTNPAIMESAMALPAEERYVALAQNSGFFEFFAARGVSVDQAVSCLSDAASVEAIAERSDKQSDELNVTSTPTFFLNGQQLTERSWAQIEDVLKRAGARTE